MCLRYDRGRPCPDCRPASPRLQEPVRRLQDAVQVIMDKQLDDLAGHIYRRASDLTPERRFLVAIAGIPGELQNAILTPSRTLIVGLMPRLRQDDVCDRSGQ